ncbi:arginine--tRNA ligase, partial [Streptomyces bambusae]|nr:arginine--tRNA ligase [Streptomyces bambusae]
MTPADLSRTVADAVRCAVADGELAVEVPARVVVERTRPGGVGEYACSVALRIAGPAGKPAREVAGLLRKRLAGLPGIASVDVTGPGFLSFAMSGDAWADVARDVVARGATYGWCVDHRPSSSPSSPSSSSPSGPSSSQVAGPGGRELVVREAVGRILRSQGIEGIGGDAGLLRVAPVPRGEGDVVRRFGAEAARWAMLAVPPQERPVFSERLLLQDESSDLFLVRYAHARSRALVRNAAQLGFTPDIEARPDAEVHAVAPPPPAAPAPPPDPPPPPPPPALFPPLPLRRAPPRIATCRSRAVVHRII